MSEEPLDKEGGAAGKQNGEGGATAETSQDQETKPVLSCYEDLDPNVSNR